MDKNPDGTLISSFALQELLVEYVNIRSLCPSGIYISASPTAPQIWYGVIFIRKGPYSGGIFRFMFFFPDQYPYVVPILKLLSPLSSHPLIHPLTYEFDFSQVEKSPEELQLYTEGDLERESRFRVNGRVLVGRVLSYFKASFNEILLDQIPGLFQRDPPRFMKLAQQDVALSRATHMLYCEDESGDSYAGDEHINAMNLVMEENVLHFMRLDTSTQLTRPLSISEHSELHVEKSSSPASLGEIGRGIWDIMARENRV
ncbi:hypothetical protein V1512DRAFT_281518 [Lipomyces arxii]|uniref:uncharacterized protein n=1 Tax=Lipomyces arxii TaxID=56418 RepID=UPI0034CE349F